MKRKKDKLMQLKRRKNKKDKICDHANPSKYWTSKFRSKSLINSKSPALRCPTRKNFLSSFKEASPSPLMTLKDRQQSKGPKRLSLKMKHPLNYPSLCL